MRESRSNWNWDTAVTCPHCLHDGLDAPAEHNGHKFTRVSEPHPQMPDLDRYRWKCSCGRRGQWTIQSDSVPYHAWRRHVGLSPDTRP